MSRQPSKKTMKRAKKQISKRKKSAAKKNMDTFFYRGRMIGSIIPSQGVTVANYISLFFKLMDPTSTTGVTQLSEFKLFQNIYDQVRINRMTVRVIPKANMLTQVEAQNEDALNVSGDGKVHTCVLRDDSSYSASTTRFIRQPSYKGFSVLKRWSRSYGIKWARGVWLDCQNIYSDETLLRRIGAYGGVGVYAENILEENSELFNEPYASLEITYDCVFRGKTSSSLSWDAETGVVSVAAPTTFVNPDPTPVVALSGTVSDTLVDGFDENGRIVESAKDDTTTQVPPPSLVPK